MKSMIAFAFLLACVAYTSAACLGQQPSRQCDVEKTYRVFPYTGLGDYFPYNYFHQRGYCHKRPCPCNCGTCNTCLGRNDVYGDRFGYGFDYGRYGVVL